jgi:bacteriocin biosynthesis cyclodehydratase domain-containing protein
MPCTVLPGRGAITLVAGEDQRYTLEGEALEAWAPALIEALDGRHTLGELIDGLAPAHREAARELVLALAGERLVVDGGPEDAHRAARHRLVVRGEGALRRELAALTPAHSEGPELIAFCQERLDFAELAACDRACRAARTPWMWITVAPVARAYVGPVLLHDAGPCAECLVERFRARSPLPGLYDALEDHAARGGVLAGATAPAWSLAVLRGLVEWKLLALAMPDPPPELYALHVLEVRTGEVTTHRVTRDPDCRACGAAP